MVSVNDGSDRLNEYRQLSMWEREMLRIWIREHVNSTALWHYTSLGIVSLFEEAPLGFSVTHAQMQQALLNAGFRPRDVENGVWIFDVPELG